MSILAVFALACTSAPPPASPPTVPPPAPGDPPPPAPTDPGRPIDPDAALITFVYAGLPAVDEPIVVHATDGAEVARYVTDAEGRIVIADIPAEGVGVTFDSALLDEVPGLTTLYGIHKGADHTFGTQAPDVIELSYQLPYGFVPDAETFVVRAGCRSQTRFAAGEQGAFTVDRRCLDDGVLDVLVVARDGTLEPVAWMELADVPVEDQDGGLVAFADLTTTGWRVAFETLELRTPGVTDGGIHSLAVWSPNQRTIEMTSNATITVNPGDLVLTEHVVIPDTPTAAVRVFTDVRPSGLDERRFWQWGAQRGRNQANTFDVEVEMPGWIGLLELDEATRSVQIGLRDPFVCADFEAPVGSAVIYQGSRDGDGFEWQVVYPGALPERVVVPETPDGWPASLDAVRVVVEEAGQTGQTYDDVLTMPRPLQELEQPAVALGEIHCRRAVATQ